MASIYEPTIIKNVLEETVFGELKTKLLSAQFPWFYYENQDRPTDNDEIHKKFLSSSTFRHYFILKGNIASSHITIISPIMEFLSTYFKHKEIFFKRVNANLLPASLDILNKHSYPHIDQTYSNEFLETHDAYSAIFYFDDGNGDTLLIDNNNCIQEIGRIIPTKNSIAIFDSRQWHCAPSFGEKKSKDCYKLMFLFK